MAAAKRIQTRNNIIREGPPDNVDGGVWETVRQLIYVTIFTGMLDACTCKGCATLYKPGWNNPGKLRGAPGQCY